MLDGLIIYKVLTRNEEGNFWMLNRSDVLLIGLIFCFIMTYLFGSVLKDSIQMLSKLFIFFVSFTHFFFGLSHNR